MNENAVESNENDALQANAREVRALNWGAFALTPFWLVRNGFLLTFVLYIGLAFVSEWLLIGISILFFLKGTQWSWGSGNRWKSFEQFAESQAVWNLTGKICLLGLAVYAVISVLMNLE